MVAKTIKGVRRDIRRGRIEAGDEIPGLEGVRLEYMEGGEITVYQAIYQVAVMCNGDLGSEDDFETMGDSEIAYSQKLNDLLDMHRAGLLRDFEIYREEGTAHGVLFANEDGEVEVDWENQNLDTVDYYRSSEAWDDEIVECEGVA